MSESLSFPVNALLCNRHGEPFRLEWPKGYLSVVGCMLSWLKSSPGFAQECEGKTDNLVKLLQEKPFCCRISKGELIQIYLDSGIGKLASCDQCKKTSQGTEYRFFNMFGKARLLKHFCFECLVKSMDFTSSIPVISPGFFKRKSIDERQS